MELNEYDKEFLMDYTQPLSELIALTGKTRGQLAEFKDFVYDNNQIYVYESKYYHYHKSNKG